MKLLSVIQIIFIFIMTIQSAHSQNRNSLTVVYNNMASENNLRCDWGYSVWIEIKNEIVLFDTGNKAALLKQNLKKLNLNPENISVVAISHNHYDHIGGLESVLAEVKKNTKVYLPVETEQNFEENFPDLKFIVNNRLQKIAKNIWITNVFEKNVPEQALVIENKEKLIIVTGCAHPGIVEMCESIKNKFPGKKIDLVTGGFHLRNEGEKELLIISDQLKQLGIDKIAPSHCSGENTVTVFKNTWQEKFVQLNLGDSYRF